MYDSLALEFLEVKTLNKQNDILEEITECFLSPNDSPFLQDPARQTYKNSILNEIENFYNSYCIKGQESYEHFLASYHAYIFPYIDKFTNEVIHGKFSSKYILHPFLIHDANYKRFYKENISIYASDLNKTEISLSRHKRLLNDNQEELQLPEDQSPAQPSKKLRSRSHKISPVSDIDNFRISNWYDEDNPLNHILKPGISKFTRKFKYSIFINGENILSTLGISLAEINGQRTLFIKKYCDAYFAIKKKMPIKFGFYENDAFYFRMFELHAWLLTYLIGKLDF